MNKYNLVEKTERMPFGEEGFLTFYIDMENKKVYNSKEEYYAARRKISAENERRTNEWEKTRNKNVASNNRPARRFLKAGGNSYDIAAIKDVFLDKSCLYIRVYTGYSYNQVYGAGGSTTVEKLDSYNDRDEAEKAYNYVLDRIANGTEGIVEVPPHEDMSKYIRYADGTTYYERYGKLIER